VTRVQKSKDGGFKNLGTKKCDKVSPLIKTVLNLTTLKIKAQGLNKLPSKKLAS
jgi:hypothetical protein